MVEIVTGSNGFIGTHLVSRLDNPLCIPHSRFSSEKLPKYDNLYYLATYGNMFFHTESESIIRANLLEPISFLQQRDDFKSFVYLSTSSVKLPIQTTYSRSKRAAEEILMSYVDAHKLPITIIRPFSVTGVGEQSQHLIPTLIRAAYSGEMVNFDPNPVHDFINVKDVINGILNLSSHQARGIFELGTGVKHTNQEVLEMVEDITVRNIKTNILPSLRPYDNTNWVSENYRARSFGWSPTITLKDSIKEMVDEYRTSKKVFGN